MAIGQFCCSVCGSREFKFSEVLWDGLTDEWQICEEERRYIDRQQGEQCIRCGSNLRSIALADGLRNVFSTDKTLSDFVASASSKASILEINEAGTLHSLLMKLPGHVFAEYPRVDMHALPFDAESFDVVVHSDTLEHVKNPVHALQECGRVLKTGGALASPSLSLSVECRVRATVLNPPIMAIQLSTQATISSTRNSGQMLGLT
ncbi:class I SAM-dependent methyltransferase [Rhizobium leguminosarum]|nr:class I SAM-dependent methyltransferase [Rhizobium leguminosarum]